MQFCSMRNDSKLKYTTIGAHLLFWICYTIYQSGMESWGVQDTMSFNLQPDIFSIIPVTILMVYVNLYMIMPRYYYTQKYLKYGIGFVALLLGTGLMQRFINYSIWVPWDKLHNPAQYRWERKDYWIPVRILRDAVKAFPVMAATMLIKLMRKAYHHEQHLREMEKEKFTAELNLLKAQINPHFFFNTLNSIYALTFKISEPASQMVLRLSDLMHYMLYETTENKVLLNEEIKHLESYIAIEQIRFADRLEVSFQYSGATLGKLIAPLILLPFVENAFKHCLAEQQGYITINLKLIDSRLFFKVENSYEENPEPKVAGLGLKNVKRRLELIYPGLYDLAINRNAGIFEIELALDL
jgi:two-component system LytT family sensor kinase